MTVNSTNNSASLISQFLVKNANNKNNQTNKLQNLPAAQKNVAPAVSNNSANTVNKTAAVQTQKSSSTVNKYA